VKVRHGAQGEGEQDRFSWDEWARRPPEETGRPSGTMPFRRVQAQEGEPEEKGEEGDG
jgi:hypothetical protein